MELITVIVPIYNVEKYLNRCIQSVVDQTYHNLDIVLIDDGSTDKSPEICDLWAQKDERIRVVHQENCGVSKARNAGLHMAKGAYIMQLDSDDFIHIETIARLYTRLKDNDADMSVCNFEKGDCESFEFETNDSDNVEIIDNVMALNRIYLGDNNALRYVAPWGKLYKRSLFENICYPEGKIFEDIYITHKILYKCKKIAVTERKWLYYYQHSSSIMNRQFHVGKLDYLEALKDRIIFFKENNLHNLSQIAYDEYIHSLIWEYSRARDLLRNKSVLEDIVIRYREIYIKGYASKRYSQDTKLFLRLFAINPEIIVLYWKICGKINKLLKR